MLYRWPLTPEVARPSLAAATKHRLSEGFELNATSSYRCGGELATTSEVTFSVGRLTRAVHFLVIDCRSQPWKVGSEEQTPAELCDR